MSADTRLDRDHFSDVVRDLAFVVDDCDIAVTDNPDWLAMRKHSWDLPGRSMEAAS